MAYRDKDSSRGSVAVILLSFGEMTRDRFCLRSNSEELDTLIKNVASGSGVDREIKGIWILDADGMVFTSNSKGIFPRYARA